MFQRLHELDSWIFHLINQSWSNPFFDRFMPILSGNPFFIPVVLAGAILLAWKGGARGRIFLIVLGLSTVLTETVVSDFLKPAIARSRPFLEIPETRLLQSAQVGNFSFPSAHAANWFSALLVCFYYYRRSIFWLAPLAILVAFSRIYIGVHYPSDVVGGALAGVFCAALTLISVDRGWRFLKKKFSPLEIEKQWTYLTYVVIFMFLLFRLGYLLSGKIELCEDEAYHWLWSKHLALSYFSKPLALAFVIRLGIFLWGDSEWGVRFFAPVIAAFLSIVILRFMRRYTDSRTCFLFLLISLATPILSAGAILMTDDALSVLFWNLAMISGWYAISTDSMKHWLWTGFWMGLGTLSKFTALLQIPCFMLFFLLHPNARRCLRSHGFYVALGVNALFTLPVFIWNAGHDWATLGHLFSRTGLDHSWQPTLRYFGEFLGSEIALLNPVFFFGIIFSCVAFWRRDRRDALFVYLFSMGFSFFLIFLIFSLRSRVQPNWISPAVIPMLCLMVLYWEKRWKENSPFVIKALSCGLILGFVIVTLIHDTSLIEKITGFSIPPKLDPLRRVRGWSEVARYVDQVRRDFAEEGRPIFIIGDHYGITSLLAFYLPEAKVNVLDRPLVYAQNVPKPINQFYFWPGYENRVGEDAICVRKTDEALPPPEELIKEFTSVTDLGIRDISLDGRPFRSIQLFLCRRLLPSPGFSSDFVMRPSVLQRRISLWLKSHEDKAAGPVDI